MARAELNEIIELSTTQGPIAGALVTVLNADSTPATVYVDATTPTPLPQPLTTKSDGSIDFWAEEGPYLLVITPSSISIQFNPQTVQVTVALTGSAVESSIQYVVGVHYTGVAPDRPNVGGAFVIWNGPTDPGTKALDGDLGVGWTP